MGVSPATWLAESRNRISGDGAKGVLESLYFAYVGALLSIAARRPLGTNVFERDWDVLVVLDACRVDMLRQVADEYDFLGEVDAIWSVGSTSVEWMALTFREQYLDEIERTGYVNGNAQFDRVFRERRAIPHRAAVPFGPSESTYGVVGESDFGVHDPVYEYGFDDDLGAVPPRAITDRAITASRGGEHDRLVVHYMQPHEPYIGADEPTSDALVKLGRGEISRERVEEMYLDTLRLVLDDVALLLENLDAERVAITADHGEGFGEWGFHSHNIGCPHPAVRKVPWVTMTAADEGTHEPTTRRRDDVSAETAEQLRRLGYR